MCSGFTPHVMYVAYVWSVVVFSFWTGGARGRRRTSLRRMAGVSGGSVPPASWRSAVRSMLPFVWPSAVMIRVSTQVSDATAPVVRCSFNHSRGNNILRSAGAFTSSVDKTLHTDMASMQTSRSTQMSPASRSRTASRADSAPRATSWRFVASSVPASMARIAACSSLVKVLRVTVFSDEQSQCRRCAAGRPRESRPVLM